MKAARRVRREDDIEEAPSIPSGHESGLNAVKRDGWIRRIDVASAIFKCILPDRLKYIQGDYPVAWAHWQRLAQELVLVLGLGHAPRASPFAAASQS